MALCLVSSSPNETFLSLPEIADLLSRGKRAVEKRAQNEGWPYIEEPHPGNYRRRYPLNGLPLEIRRRYSATLASSVPIEACGPDNQEGPGIPPESTEHCQTAPILASGAGSDLLAQAGESPPLPESFFTRVCPGLTRQQSKLAAGRFDLVMLFQKAIAAAKRCGMSRGSAAQAFMEGYNSGTIYPALYATIGDVALKTVYKWGHLLEQGGYDMKVLAEKYGQHRKGKRRVTAAEMEAVLKYALHPNRLRASQVIRWAKLDLAQRGTPSPSSESTMRRALLDWKAANYDKWVFSREGEKALADKVLPYIERESARLSVGECLVADGHPLNFQIINPFTGRPGRATLLMFFDWASRFPAGWYVMFTENIQAVHAALRRAIVALGKIPKAVYLDNGKAFRAKVFTDASIDFDQEGIRGLYGRLGIETHFAKPYNAKAKPVERFFGTFNELERLVPSYTGASIADKPAHTLRNERLHKRLHNPHVPTLEEAHEIIRAWAWEAYARRKHSGIDAAPADVWLAGKGPGVDEEHLRDLMMTSEVKTIHRNGITLFGAHYYDDALYGYRSPVLVRYDILDMTRIHVYTADGATLLCTALPVSLMHPLAARGTTIDREMLKQALIQHAQLKKDTEASWRQTSRGTPWMTALPGPQPQEKATKSQRRLTRAEIEQIEQDATKVEVIHPQAGPATVLFMHEGEAYEHHILARARGETLTEDQLSLMAEYEKGKQYRMLKPYYEKLLEQASGGSRTA